MWKGRKHPSFLWTNMKNQCRSFFCSRSRFQKFFQTFLGRGRGGPRQRVRRALFSSPDGRGKSFLFFLRFSNFSIKNLKVFQKINFLNFYFLPFFRKMPISKNDDPTSILTCSIPTNVIKWRWFMYPKRIFTHKTHSEEPPPNARRKADGKFFDAFRRQ